MPLPAKKLADGPDIKVLILNGEGKYLAGDRKNWFFTEDRAAAVVLNHRADRVPEQLAHLRSTQGISLEEVPVPLGEIYEACDRCKELFMPSMVFFDGKRFLCTECRNGMLRSSPRSKSP